MVGTVEKVKLKLQVLAAVVQVADDNPLQSVPVFGSIKLAVITVPVLTAIPENFMVMVLMVTS